MTMNVLVSPDNLGSIRNGLTWLSASWRWDRARLLARLGRRCDSRFGDDEWTRHAVLHHHYAAAGTLTSMAKRSPMLAAVAGAVELANGPEIERLALEARLIARDGLEAIAAKTEKPVAVIEAYEKLFCDFRERHDSESWMCDRVIRGHLYLSRPQTLRSAVLTLAHRDGPGVADQVLATVSSYVRGHSWAKISRAAIDAPAIDRLTLMALATQMAPRTVEAQRKLQRQYRKLKRELGWFGDAGIGEKSPDVNEGGPALWKHLCDRLDAAYASQGADEDEVEVA